jgi:iron complex transport system substrate-binding protein
VNRIISLAPHITEIIFKLGSGDRLVGRTDFCRYPAKALLLPSLGGYLNTNYEKIVTLKPDLILQFPNLEMQKKLESLGFRVENISNETIEEVLAGILRVGALLDITETAKRLQNNIRDTLDIVSDVGHKLPTKRTALLLVGRTAGTLEKLYAAGRNSYLSQIWEHCGGQNAFSGVTQKYFTLSKEDLIVHHVDMILEFRPEEDWSEADILEEIKLWEFFRNLDAVKNSKVYIFTESMFLIPGPRISKIAVQFSKLINEK